MDYRVQAISINTSRAVYALNWFDIAPGLGDIASSLNLQIVQLGIVTTGFYIGLASFQLFGGFAASRIGNRRTEAMGLVVLGISVIGSGLAPNLPVLFLTRLTAGFGSAFFFSPALGMLAEIVPEEKYTFYVGSFNGSFNVGAAVGAFGWVYVDQFLGWRAGLVIGGLMTIFLAIENTIVLRGVIVHTSRGRNLLSKMKITMRSRAMWILPVAGIGSMVFETIIGQFFIYYGENSLLFSPTLAGSLEFVFLIMGFVGGLIGGYQYSRTRNKKATFVTVMAILGILAMILPLVKSPILLGLLLAVLGVMVVDGFSILYTIAAGIAPDKSMVSFSLSFVNFMQQLVGAAFPFIFTGIIAFSGYQLSWFAMGAISTASILLFPLAYGEKVAGGRQHKMDFNKSS